MKFEPKASKNVKPIPILLTGKAWFNKHSCVSTDFLCVKITTNSTKPLPDIIRLIEDIL